MRRTPLRNKRLKPRRKAPERVQATRIRPKAGKRASAQEKAHFERIAAMPCLACGAPPPSTVHHVVGSIFGYRLTKNHRRVVPLCPRHHFQQFGPKESVEALSHKGFYFVYGINLEEEAERLWAELTPPQ